MRTPIEVMLEAPAPREAIVSCAAATKTPLHSSTTQLEQRMNIIDEAKSFPGMWGVVHEPVNATAPWRRQQYYWRTADRYIWEMTRERASVGRNRRITFAVPHKLVQGLLSRADIKFVTAIHIVLVDRDQDGVMLVDAPWALDIRALLHYRAVAWQDHDSLPNQSIVHYVIPLERPHTMAEYSTLCATVKKVLPAGARIEDPEIPVEQYCLSLANAKNRDEYVEDFEGPLFTIEDMMGTRSKASMSEDANIFRDGCARLAVLQRTDLFRWCAREGTTVPKAIFEDVVLAIFALADAADGSAKTENGFEQADGVRQRCNKAAMQVLNAQCGECAGETFASILRQSTIFSRRPRSCAAIEADRCAVHVPKCDGSLFDMAVATVTDFGDQDPQLWVYDMVSSCFRQRGEDGYFISPNIDTEDTTSSGYTKDDFALYLSGTLPNGSKTFVDDFKSKVPPALRVGPVYSSRDALVRVGRNTILNTFRFPTIKPVPGDVSLVLQLLMNLTSGDAAAVEYILDWLARPLQSLWLHGVALKLEIALVFFGVQGAGKDTLGRLIELMYGLHNLARLDQDTLEAKFTALLRGKLIVICNEVNSGTRAEAKLANKLKSMVTEKEGRIEGKGTNPFSANSRYNMLFFSNDPRTVAIEKTDRRFSVFQSYTSLGGDVATALNADIEGAAAHLLDFLLKRAVHRSPREIYNNTARAKMQLASASVIRKFVDEGLAKRGFKSLFNDLSCGLDYHPLKGLIPDDEIIREYVSFESIVALIDPWCRATGNVTPKSISEALSDALEDAFRAKSCGSLRVTDPNDKKRRFNAWKGIPLEVDDEETPVRWSGDALVATPAGKSNDDIDVGGNGGGRVR